MLVPSIVRRSPQGKKAGATAEAGYSVGAGVLEYRIDSGPGYRIYLGRDGDALIVLLGGGTKARQQRDIETARKLWREYRRRKRPEK